MNFILRPVPRGPLGSVTVRKCAYPLGRREMTTKPSAFLSPEGAGDGRVEWHALTTRSVALRVEAAAMASMPTLGCAE